MARRSSGGTTRGFSNAVNKWTKETKERSEEAFREGSKDFYDALAAATPVDTGALRGSLVATTKGSVESSGPTNIYTDEGNGAAESYMNIDSAQLGDKISYRYRAPYWIYVNNGTINMPGRFWVEQVGARYVSIMRAAATRLKLRMK